MLKATSGLTTEQLLGKPTDVEDTQNQQGKGNDYNSDDKDDKGNTRYPGQDDFQHLQQSLAYLETQESTEDCSQMFENNESDQNADEDKDKTSPFRLIGTTQTNPLSVMNS